LIARLHVNLDEKFEDLVAFRASAHTLVCCCQIEIVVWCEGHLAAAHSMKHATARHSYNSDSGIYTALLFVSAAIFVAEVTIVLNRTVLARVMMTPVNKALSFTVIKWIESNDISFNDFSESVMLVRTTGLHEVRQELQRRSLTCCPLR
jgi:hypothetical protein